MATQAIFWKFCFASGRANKPRTSDRSRDSRSQLFRLAVECTIFRFLQLVHSVLMLRDQCRFFLLCIGYIDGQPKRTPNRMSPSSECRPTNVGLQKNKKTSLHFFLFVSALDGGGLKNFGRRSPQGWMEVAWKFSDVLGPFWTVFGRYLDPPPSLHKLRPTFRTWWPYHSTFQFVS